MIRALILALGLLLSFQLFAQVPDSGPLQFQSAAEEQRFHDLASELRCVMCQNQSLADSNAQIAIELRKEVLNLMREGKDNRQIKEFLVQRYGEFVLYKPEYSGRNAVLWIAPIAMLLIALGALLLWQRKHKPAAVAQDAQQKDVEW